MDRLMMMNPTPTLQERVVNNFNSIDRVLKFFLPLAGLTCILKFTNKLTLSVNGLELPTKWAWAVFVVFTFAHLFTTWRFQQSAKQFVQHSNASDRQNRNRHPDVLKDVSENESSDSNDEQKSELITCTESNEEAG